MIGNPKRRVLIADYDQKIEAYVVSKGASFGDGDINTLLFTGLAKVEELGGFKALQYQQQGVANPVIIEMNWIDTLPSYVMWNDNKIPIVSFVDPDNHFKRRVIMLGTYVK